MSSTQAVTTLDLPTSSGLKKIASGKVREIFEMGGNTLLFVATDRISAYDVILENGVPDKGALLTQLSAYWLDLIKAQLPDLQTHLISTSIPASIPQDIQPQLANRSMLVRRLPLVKLESIVRGYITGSAWSEYKTKGTVHGMSMPAGLQESEQFAHPLWTPSTKAEQGEHDENISREQAIELVGEEVARKVEAASLAVYGMAHAHALARGIIIADTKFEFGVEPGTGEIVLVDEVLTPDSSRFWPAGEYAVGKGQRSYDKQFLRDWLTGAGLKGEEGVSMPEEVVQGTAEKYREAFEKITGKVWG